MSKYVVTVFDDEKGAYDGARALIDLDNQGSIAVYEGAVISKEPDGRVRIRDEATEGPIGTMSGMLLGSMIGVLGGPGGLVAGAAAGSLGGMMVDLYDVGVGDAFLDDVAVELTPGKHAVVAEIGEGWTLPLDSRMEELGGRVFRHWRLDVEDDQIDRDIQATQRELDELEAEWAQASADSKAKLQAKVDAAKAKLSALDEKARKKLATLKEQTDAKIDKLNKQIAKAGDDFKTGLEKSRDDLKADYEKRSKKLKEAGQLAAEALG